MDEHEMAPYVDQPEERPFSRGDSRTLVFRSSLSEEEVQQLLSAQDELFLHVDWCYFHEGVRVFDDSEPGNIRAIATLRSELLNCQAHNPGAQALIRAASNDLLHQTTIRAIQSVEQRHQLWQNFTWVAYHEGERDNFRRALARNDFGEIRRIYFNRQSHNPNAKNLLALVSNGMLRRMVNAL